MPDPIRRGLIVPLHRSVPTETQNEVEETRASDAQQPTPHGRLSKSPRKRFATTALTKRKRRRKRELRVEASLSPRVLTSPRGPQTSEEQPRSLTATPAGTFRTQVVSVRKVFVRRVHVVRPTCSSCRAGGACGIAYIIGAVIVYTRKR